MEIIILIMQIVIAGELLLLIDKKEEVKEEPKSRRVVTDAYGYRDPLTGYRTNSRGQYVVRRPNEEYGADEDEI